MRITLLVAVATVGAGLLVPAHAAGIPATSTTGEVPVHAATRADGIIVKLGSAGSGAAVVRAAGTGLRGARVTRSRALGAGMRVISFSTSVPASVAAASARAAEAAEGVAWAVPDLRVQPDFGWSDDPDLGEQYNIDDTEGYGTHANDLWNVTTSAAAPVVAVVDTGVLVQHPDLVGQTVAGYDFVDGDTDATDPGDHTTAGECGDGEPAENSSWHGTHVAGIIAATRNNSVGVAGLADDAKIEPVRVLGACGGDLSTIVEGIEWASGAAIAGVPTNEHPAEVINLSLGGDRYLAGDDTCPVWAEAARIAQERGALLVAAAGNDFADTATAAPASCAGYLTVAATGRTGHLAYYSNTGSAVAISAPGGDDQVDHSQILSTYDTGTTGHDAYTYAAEEGTSMAAPAVSAAAADLISLGITGPSALTAAIRAAVQPFATDPDGTWAKYPVTVDGWQFPINLDCAPDTCGSGVLDLDMVPAPYEPLMSTGQYWEGGTMSVDSAWQGPAKIAKTVTWRVDGVVRQSGPSATYRIRTADIGRTVVATEAPDDPAFAGIAISTSILVSSKHATTVRLSAPKKISTKAHAKLSIRLTTTAAQTPTGTIIVRVGSRIVARSSVTPSKRGKVDVTLPRLSAGRKVITVAYAGSRTQLAGSAQASLLVQ